MALFVSTFVNKIDKKGRVSVPASFRHALSDQGFNGVVLFASSQHGAIEGVSWEFMQEMADRLDHYDLFSGEQDDVATAIFGDSVQLPLDGDGRIILPPSLIEFAGLDGECAFVGMGRKFQIWNKKALDERKAQARKNMNAQKLTLPKGGRNE